MPFGNIWTCNQCGYSIRTAGYFKFYVDKNGNRKRFAHPIPSEADKNATATGYSQEGFCPHCKEIRDVIVAIFPVPQNDLLDAHNPETKLKEFPAICDKCNTPLKDDLEGEICPKCNIGHFKESGRFMS
jgi:rubrerythrin